MSTMKNPVFHIIGALIVLLGLSSAGVAYVGSAGRTLEPLLKAYHGVRTVKIIMETTVYDAPSGETKVKELLAIAEGGRFRAERKFPRGNDILIQGGRTAFALGVEESDAGARRIDTVFPTVFFQKSVPDLLNALNFLGVDTRTVGIDRIDRKVVIVIGTRSDEAPGSRVWIERERRLPLRFVGVGVSGGETVVLKAEYTEYRQVDKDVWLPGKIAYYRNDTPWIVSVIQSVSLNESLPDALFRIPQEGEPGIPITDFLNIKE
ncbi:MAG: hypothetical protein JXI32_06630 [Deltaproteobacteria bacterium]|nr:hypothetical protein [Deltaproteobacteria bacterium]